jgi:hypothetical protein
MCINCWNVASTFGRCIKCWIWAGDWPPWIQILTSDTMLILVFVRRQWGHIWLGRLIYLLSEVCAIYRNGIQSIIIIINKQNINGDINGMLTSPFSRFSSLSCW